MNPLDKAIGEALHVDPIKEAQEFTGKDYTKDKSTDALAFHILHQNAADKEALLSLSGDTLFHNKFDRYMSICESIGFKLVLTVPFIVRSKEEKQCFLYKPGCLLVLDTGDVGDSINSSNFYYNWTPKSGSLDAYHKEPWVHSSGHWNKEGADGGLDIWSGDHDAREALKYKLKRLEQYGNYVLPWRYRPFVSLCHYQDYRDTEGRNWKERSELHDIITEHRISLLPKEIQEVIPNE